MEFDTEPVNIQSRRLHRDIDLELHRPREFVGAGHVEFGSVNCCGSTRKREIRLLLRVWCCLAREGEASRSVDDAQGGRHEVILR